MDRRAAGALLALVACFACSAAAPTTSDKTALDTYEGSEGCYYNFQHYGEGDRIMTNEPCLNCTCHNRMLMCYLRVCPFTKAIGQDCTVEKRADQCCPIVTCPDVPVDLLTSTSTNSPAEYGSTGLGKQDKYGCSIDGKYFPEGAKVPPMPNRPCEHCYCIRNMTTCVMQECTLHVDGCTPIYHKDVCCPVRYSCDHPEDEIPMLDDMTTTVRPTPGFLLTTTTIAPVTQQSQYCIHDDEIIPDGALIKTDKACQHCYCMKGDMVCVVQDCGVPMENEGKNCTSLPPREGECCPDTYICEGDELATELPPAMETGLPQQELTTLLPPRRVVEGSGYRNEPDESPYTEIPTLATEIEGSGEEQLTPSSIDSIMTVTEKEISPMVDELITTTEIADKEGIGSTMSPALDGSVMTTDSPTIDHDLRVTVPPTIEGDITAKTEDELRTTMTPERVDDIITTESVKQDEMKTTLSPLLEIDSSVTQKPSLEDEFRTTMSPISDDFKTTSILLDDSKTTISDNEIKTTIPQISEKNTITTALPSLDKDVITATEPISDGNIRTTASPVSEETIQTTTEADKGENTIPDETPEEHPSDISGPVKTTVAEDDRTTIPSIYEEPETSHQPDKITASVDDITTEGKGLQETDPDKLTTISSSISQDTFTTESPVKEILTTETESEPKLTTSSSFVTNKEEEPTVFETPTTESVLTASSSLDDKELPENLFPSVETTTLTIDKQAEQESTTFMTPEDIGRIPGEGDCLVDGITYKNFTIVPSTNKCQTSCRCISSIIKCDPIICSLPPQDMENMNNCQPIYDTPDSCCPTYVCDNMKETIPPQPHSQMSGTESSITSKPDLECTGDDCQVKDKEDHPSLPCSSEECHERPVSSETKPDDCSSGSCLNDNIVPVQSSDQNCEGDKCKSPTTEQCNGDNCDQEPQITPAKDESSTCVNGEDCMQEPVDIKPSCDGEECEQVPVVQPSCEGEECNQVPIDVKPACEGDNCQHKPTDVKPACEGNNCQQEPIDVKPACEGDKCQQEPIDVKPVCEGDNCQQHPIDVKPVCEGDKCQHEPIDVKPVCEGDNCQQEPIDVKPVCEGDKCQQEPVDVKLSCEGEECKHVPVIQPGCEGEGCQQEPIFSKPSCEGENCQQEPIVGKPACEGDNCQQKPIDFKPACEGDNCQQEPIDVKPACEGDNCQQEPIDVKPACEGDNCQQEPIVGKPACEGDNCKQEPIDVKPACEGENCQQEPIVGKPVCEGDNCKQKPIDFKPACEGDNCQQEPIDVKPACEGENCQQEPIDVKPACEGDNCQQEPIVGKPACEGDICQLKPTDFKPACEGDNCQQEPIDVKPACEGDNCQQEPIVGKPACEGDICQLKPTDFKPACEGDNCQKTPIEVKPVCEGENCQQEPIDVKETCEGEECKQQPIDVKPLCEGDFCTDTKADCGPNGCYSTNLPVEQTTESVACNNESGCDKVGENDVGVICEGEICRRKETSHLDTPHVPESTEVPTATNKTESKQTISPNSMTATEESYTATEKPNANEEKQTPMIETTTTIFEASGIDNTVEPQSSSEIPQAHDLDTQSEYTTQINDIATDKDQEESSTPNSLTKTDEDHVTQSENTTPSTMDSQTLKETNDVTVVYPDVVTVEESSGASTPESHDNVQPTGPEEVYTEPSVDLQTVKPESDEMHKASTTVPDISIDLEQQTKQPEQNDLEMPDITRRQEDNEDVSVTKATTAEENTEKATTSAIAIVKDTEKSDSPESSTVIQSQSEFATELQDIFTPVPNLEDIPTDVTSELPVEKEIVPTTLGINDATLQPETLKPSTESSVLETILPEDIDMTLPESSEIPEKPIDDVTTSSPASQTESPATENIESQPTVTPEQAITSSEKEQIPVSSVTEPDTATNTEKPIIDIKTPKNDQTPKEAFTTELPITTEEDKNIMTELNTVALDTATETLTPLDHKEQDQETGSPDFVTETHISTEAPLTSEPDHEVVHKIPVTDNTEPTYQEPSTDGSITTIFKDDSDTVSPDHNTEINEVSDDKLGITTQHPEQVENIESGITQSPEIVTETTLDEKDDKTTTKTPDSFTDKPAADDSNDIPVQTTSIPESNEEIQTELSVPGIEITGPSVDSVEKATETSAPSTSSSSTDTSPTEKLEIPTEETIKPDIKDDSEPEMTEKIQTVTEPATETKQPDLVPEVVTMATELPEELSNHKEVTTQLLDIQEPTTASNSIQKQTSTEEPVMLVTEAESKPTVDFESSMSLVTKEPTSTSSPVDDIITEMAQENVTEPQESEYTTIASLQSVSEPERSPVTKEPESMDEENPEMGVTEIPHDHVYEETPSPVETDKPKAEEPTTKLPEEQEPTTESKQDFSETTPYFVELDIHTHKAVEESSTNQPINDEITTEFETEKEVRKPDYSTELPKDEEQQTETPTKEEPKPADDKQQVTETSLPAEASTSPDVYQTTSASELITKPSEPATPKSPDNEELDTRYGDENKQSVAPTQSVEESDLTTPSIYKETEKPSLSDDTIISQTDKNIPESSPEDALIPPTTNAPISKDEVSTSQSPTEEKVTEPDDKETEALPNATTEVPEPGPNEIQSTDEIPSPDDEFPSGGTSGYGQEPDYDDQVFGPGTCRYGGKVYVSAQQIPRDDPCDFCFCFRSDIICLQQSCPPPIHGCREEPIQGFCCPRYECPVSMATTLNLTTTTTTTTTILPPHFLPHAYKGAAQRRGCQIKGHTYKVGEVVRASSGPCLHCTCGGDGQMKCDPKACTPEPMLRQMIAAAVSSKRRR